MTGVHGSELLSTEAVSGGQTKTLSASSPTTVDVAADLAFKVAFKNSGNFQEVKVPVTLTVSVFKKKVLNETKRVPVDPEGADQDRLLREPQPAAVGLRRQRHGERRIGKVPGETTLSNNHASYPVFFSLPSG